jgi:dephospho-CoA kinase
VLRVGLTGSYASGKSVVGEMLAKRGAHVIQADRIAHELMQPGEPVYAEVVQHFGRQILDPDGRINRSKLAEAAFGSSSSEVQGSAGQPITELNRIVHPAVIARQEQWMEETGRRDPNAIAVVEAALIFEAGVGDHFDKLLVVTCPPEIRLQRLAARLHLDPEQAGMEMDRRMKAQMSDEQKARLADYVIDNSGSLAQTEQQVDRIFAELRTQIRP